MQIRRALALTPLVSAWIALGACGVPRSVAVPDDDEDAGDAATAAETATESGFGPSDAAALLDAPAAAMGRCDPACSASELCYANVFTGGRAPGDDSGIDAELDVADLDGAADAADAGHSIGCHPLPPACSSNASCACVLDALGNVCAYVLSCVDDAGAPVVTCTANLP